MTLTKNKLGYRQAVFHLIGNISNPVQISHTYDNDRIIFDFRTRKVRFESGGGWEKIDTISNAERLKVFKTLILRWEHLNYQQSIQEK